MVVKVLEITNIANVKKLLEAEDYYEVKASCQKCDDKIEGRLGTIEVSQLEPTEARGKTKPPAKNSKCGEPFKFENKVFVANEFKMQGYKLQDAASLGISKEVSYLYIKASEEFFKKHEKTLLDAGAKELKGTELKEVQHKFESAEERSVEGMGAIFG